MDRHMTETQLRAFAEQVARLTLFTETLDADEDPDAAQTDLDWLIAQDETLETLIHDARKLCGQE